MVVSKQTFSHNLETVLERPLAGVADEVILERLFLLEFLLADIAREGGLLMLDLVFPHTRRRASEVTEPASVLFRRRVLKRELGTLFIIIMG